jgi:magnesium chelatase subunit I
MSLKKPPASDEIQPAGQEQPVTTGEAQGEQSGAKVRSLRELIELVSGKGFDAQAVQEESGLAEVLPFPFLALVGQVEMKLALVLSLINPAIGGVLLIGPRGTGKTTAVRSLLDLLPEVARSTCFYGCLPEDIEAGGIDAVCPDCARKYAMGEPLTKMDRVRLVELPLNARLEDVVGGLDERAVIHERMRLRRGILAHADRNILYVDEVNLLADEIVDAILDASAQGTYTVRRGPITATYYARFSLVGSMNPEEGKLRPQIMDRFGLRVLVQGLKDPEERLEAYRRTIFYRTHPRRAVAQYKDETDIAREEVQLARELLPSVEIPDKIARGAIEMVRRLKIDSLRAEITLFEAARALAAAEGRQLVSNRDITMVAPMALRLRRSTFMRDYFEHQGAEEEEMAAILKELMPQS